MSELIPLGDIVEPFADAMPPALSHLLFGAIGGLLYLLTLKRKNYVFESKWEYVARPVFGAISAYVLTEGFGIPNHITSIFVGYFGVDVWDALSTWASRRFGRALPLAFEHVRQEDLDRAITQRVDEMRSRK